MEYSVYDLIRILLKKWYVILLVMALLGGAAGVFSQRSYQAALADYEDYTSRAAPVNTEVGSYTAVYQCGFTVTDFSRYQGQYAQKNAFINGFLADESVYASAEYRYAAAEAAFAAASSDFSALFTHPSVTEALQAFVSEKGYSEPEDESAPLVAADHFSASADSDGLVTVSISALPEEMAWALTSAYFKALAQNGEELYSKTVRSELLTESYIPQTPALTQDALLSQTVMQQPERAPMFLRAAGKGAAVGFLLACFGVLLYTFIRDTAPAEKHRGSKETA